MKIIDLTHTISEDMPVYPGTEKPRLEKANTYEKDGFKETKLNMYSHTGTHVDPPAHLFADKITLDAYPVSQFVGNAIVIDCKHLTQGEFITMNELAPYKDNLDKVDFLLFNTGWDKKWGTEEYFGDYPCVDDEVLDFIISKNYKGIGFDVIGLDPIADVNLTRHKKLFSCTQMINIENLKDLHLLGDKPFKFICLPIKIENCDGSPIRAIAWLE